MASDSDDVSGASEGDLVGKVGLAEGEEASVGEEGDTSVGQADAVHGVELPGGDSRRRQGAAGGGGDEAGEAREDVGDEGVAGGALDGVFVGPDVTAAERRGSAAVGEAEGVEHTVAVEEVVRPAGEELRVRAVSDVGSGEALRDRAVLDFALRRGELVVDGSEVVGENLPGVHRGPARRVDEVVDYSVDGVEYRPRKSRRSRIRRWSVFGPDIGDVGGTGAE